MRKLLIYLIVSFYCNVVFSQLSSHQLNQFTQLSKTDERINLMMEYYALTADSAQQKIIDLNKVLQQFEYKKDVTGTGVTKYVLGYIYLAYLEDYTNSVKYAFSGLQDFTQLNDSTGIMNCTFLIGSSFQYSRNFDEAINYFKKSLIVAKQFEYGKLYANLHNAIADCYVRMKKPGNALPYVREAVRMGLNLKDTLSYVYYIGTLGEVYLANKNYDSAKAMIYQSLKFAKYTHDTLILGNIFNSLSQVCYETNQLDSSIYYARQAIIFTDYQSTVNDAYEWMYKSFEKKNEKDSSLKYFKLTVGLRDSLFSKEKNGIIQALNFQQQLWEKEKQQQLIQAKQEFNNRLKLYIVLGVLLIILIATILLYRNNRQQKKSKLKIQTAYTELKSTQSQLIQSEKMASLGELTAGIAHEIQNPLNFVNNFSDVNKELLAEMKDEIDKGNLDGAKEIANDVIANEEKINHHGKRADAIVKGMLQHSRSSSGVKEPTDINALCDEYFRLAYHGIRAKDKSFNATLKTNFDESIGNINIIPQDIGRVILNLITNAFYAVNEKKKSGTEHYEPTVSVTTKRINDKAQIVVADNGNGIPQNIIDKIFQPFFTTKPTGLGTGLGLSLAYDIVKAHGGEIKVESRKPLPDDPVEHGYGTKFIILLPLK